MGTQRNTTIMPMAAPQDSVSFTSIKNWLSLIPLLVLFMSIVGAYFGLKNQNDLLTIKIETLNDTVIKGMARIETNSLDITRHDLRISRLEDRAGITQAPSNMLRAMGSSKPTPTPAPSNSIQKQSTVNINSPMPEAAPSPTPNPQPTPTPNPDESVEIRVPFVEATLSIIRKGLFDK